MRPRLPVHRRQHDRARRGTGMGRQRLPLRGGHASRPGRSLRGGFAEGDFGGRCTDSVCGPDAGEGPSHRARRSAPSLRRIITGGETLDPSVAHGLIQRFGVKIQNTYGMTEGFCTATDPNDPGEIDAGCVGLPCLDDDLEVRDPQGEQLPPGAPGALWVRGPALLDGYVDDWPVLDERGFFATGDIAKVDTIGQVFVGRQKRLVSRGGLKISPEEIEWHLLAHPAVRDAAVVGVPDALLGQRLCAALVARSGATAPEADELRGFLAERGVGRLLQPDVVVVLDKLEKTAVGKMDWRALGIGVRKYLSNVEEAG